MHLFVFNNDNNLKYFWSINNQHIRMIYEGSCYTKDLITAINNIFIYIHIENSCFKFVKKIHNIAIFNVFLIK